MGYWYSGATNSASTSAPICSANATPAQAVLLDTADPSVAIKILRYMAILLCRNRRRSSALNSRQHWPVRAGYAYFIVVPIHIIVSMERLDIYQMKSHSPVSPASAFMLLT